MTGWSEQKRESGLLNEVPVFKSSAVSAQREKMRALGSEWRTVSFPDRIFEVELIIPLSREVTIVTGERPPL
jgi:hypothetical protein